MLPFAAVSVNALPATSIVLAPSVVGVKVAVYTVEEVEAKLLIAPLPTEISLATKVVVASLEVKVNESVPSLDVKPSEPWDAVIVIVGATVS